MTIQFNSGTEEIRDDKGQVYPDCLIVERPDLKSPALVMGERLITILFWSFWFYLWLPLISLLAWLVGIKFLYRQMVELGGFTGFLEQINVFAIGLALVCSAVASWSYYNYVRYAHCTRRTKILKIDKKKMADSLRVAEERLSEIQQAKRIVFFFGEDDSIENIATSDAAPQDGS
jgi:biofilm PGA synthesis protein PgaD